MIIEQRIYTLKLASTPRYLAAYEQYALGLQRKYLGALVGHYTSDMGILNQVVFQWAFENYADREQRREALYADPEWKVWTVKSLELELIVQQDIRVFKPSPFFEATLRAIMAASTKN